MTAGVVPVLVIRAEYGLDGSSIFHHGNAIALRFEPHSLKIVYFVHAFDVGVGFGNGSNFSELQLFGKLC